MVAVTIPPKIAVETHHRVGTIRQLSHAGSTVEFAATPFSRRGLQGTLLKPSGGQSWITDVLVIGRKTQAKGLPEHVLLAEGADLSKCDGGVWLRPSPFAEEDFAVAIARRDSVRASWNGQFSFKREVRRGAAVIEPGLRPPQIGALHGILSRWTLSSNPSTVVMPTGTGKTETMLAMLTSQALDRPLVMVPTDALREQVGEKFLTLGILKAADALAADAELPVVGLLQGIPRDTAEVDDFFTRCNVVVTTAAVMSGCTGEVRRRVAELCSHLFVDEAHHVAADGWSTVRDTFKDRRVVQFTATPYRGDGKLVEGDLAYRYPMALAQKEGYFRPIKLQRVIEDDDEVADRTIAEAALKALDADLAAGYEHLLMARCASVPKAKAVVEVYKDLAPQHAPLLVYAKQGKTANADALAALRCGSSRVVVCVNMLGEGFDLPQLKIAALHDVHKGLAVTLQFIGRFTRAGAGLGDATAVANVADASVEGRLRELYGRDPDWNRLLREIGDEAIDEQVRRGEFVSGFDGDPVAVSLQNVMPKMSAVVYRTDCGDWKPERLADAFGDVTDGPHVNAAERVALIVSRRLDPVSWADAEGLRDVSHDLCLAYWDRGRSLLFLHLSDRKAKHRRIGQSLCGTGVTLVQGDQVFRTLHGVSQRLLGQIGIGHSLDRHVSHTNYLGRDTEGGLLEAVKGNRFKSMIFARGFRGNGPVTTGCARKGRIWSGKSARDVRSWVAWCTEMGAKINDDSISADDVLQGYMVCRTPTERPVDRAPLVLSWPSVLLEMNEENVVIAASTPEASTGESEGAEADKVASAPIFDIEIAPDDPSPAGDVTFKVASESAGLSSRYRFAFGGDGAYVEPVGSDTLLLTAGRRWDGVPLSAFLAENPPSVRFHDGSYLEEGLLYEPRSDDRSPIPRDRIVAWDWTGVNLKVESQREEKREDSIQYRVIDRLLAVTGDEAPDVILDDDGSGEVADVVTVRVRKGAVHLDLYHCKYSAEKKPGARVGDLYEVCGQAQRSVHWCDPKSDVFEWLIHRLDSRVAKGRPSGLERGTRKGLRVAARRSRVVPLQVRVHIVQPGLSQEAASEEQLKLLATTETYLSATYSVPLLIAGSH